MKYILPKYLPKNYLSVVIISDKEYNTGYFSEMTTQQIYIYLDILLELSQLPWYITFFLKFGFCKLKW